MIPLTTLDRQNNVIGKEIIEAINEVIKSGVFILGPKVAEFEEAFAKYLGVKYAVGVASGTDAISLSLLALGIGSGDGVIMPANSYPSVFAVTAIGAIPQLVDIDPESYTIDPAKIEGFLNKRTKAILPVHMYGQPADMEAVLKISNKHDIPVIEDCAQAHGSEYRKTAEVGLTFLRTSQTRPARAGLEAVGVLKKQNLPAVNSSSEKMHKVGSLGTLGCFSFYPTKNLGCFGDGGMVVTNNKELADRVRLLRMYGEKGRYNSVLAGRNSRLDEIQAAILLVKLRYLDQWNNQRRKIANKYMVQLLNCSIVNNKFNNSTIQQCNNITFPYEAEYTKHIYHLFVIRTKKRDQLKAYLESRGVMTGIHYPTPVHLVSSMKSLGYKKGDFPQSERASLEVLSLPCFPELEEEEIKHISEKIKSFNI